VERSRRVREWTIHAERSSAPARGTVVCIADGGCWPSFDRLPGAGVDEAVLVGVDDYLYPVAEAQLGERAGYMGFHGGFADDEC